MTTSLVSLDKKSSEGVSLALRTTLKAESIFINNTYIDFPSIGSIRLILV